MNESVGMVEITGIAQGFVAQDAMLKAGDVRLVLARTICSGKYIVAVRGPLADIEAAVEAGLDALPDGLIDHAVIPRLHPQVPLALGGNVELRTPQGETALPGAVGLIETFSAVSVLEAADVAAKAASVRLLRLHLAMALGGKGYLLVAGSVADIREAVERAAAPVREKGLLVAAVTIPGPSRELLSEFL